MDLDAREISFLLYLLRRSNGYNNGDYIPTTLVEKLEAGLQEVK